VLPAYGRHVGGVAGGWGSGVVGWVSFTGSTLPNGTVTNLRPGWVSQKNLRAPVPQQMAPFRPCVDDPLSQSLP
jgi:hypothetical protein